MLKKVFEIIALLFLIIAIIIHIRSFFIDWDKTFDELVPMMCVFAITLYALVLPTMLDEFRNKKSLIYGQRSWILMSRKTLITNFFLWLYPILITVLALIVNIFVGEGISQKNNLILTSAIPISAYGSLFLYYRNIYGKPM